MYHPRMIQIWPFFSQGTGTGEIRGAKVKRWPVLTNLSGHTLAASVLGSLTVCTYVSNLILFPPLQAPIQVWASQPAPTPLLHRYVYLPMQLWSKKVGCAWWLSWWFHQALCVCSPSPGKLDVCVSGNGQLSIFPREHQCQNHHCGKARAGFKIEH